jgi:hypothetical protein
MIMMTRKKTRKGKMEDKRRFYKKKKVEAHINKEWYSDHSSSNSND